MSKSEPVFQKSKRSLFSTINNFCFLFFVFFFNIRALITGLNGGFAGQFQVGYGFVVTRTFFPLIPVLRFLRILFRSTLFRQLRPC